MAARLWAGCQAGNGLRSRPDGSSVGKRLVVLVSAAVDCGYCHKVWEMAKDLEGANADLKRDLSALSLENRVLREQLDYLRDLSLRGGMNNGQLLLNSYSILPNGDPELVCVNDKVVEVLPVKMFNGTANLIVDRTDPSSSHAYIVRTVEKQQPCGGPALP